jgi:3-isopropylmalate dehydratase small subunit
MSIARTIIDKVWDAHCVRAETADAPAILYVDLHLVHEVTSPQAFAELTARGLRVRRPERTLATLDHSTPTLAPGPDGKRPYADASTEQQVATLARNCSEFDIELLDFDSGARGIVHVIGPELGATQPGMTIVCGDSHTATHGAFGALAFGIGTTEVGHVLATQCLLQRRPKTLAVTVEGKLPDGVGAKDLILHIIGELGMDGGTGYVIEYRGAAIRALDMEARMTLCNMSIEAGARAGMVAPDDITFAYLRGRPKAPQGAAFDAAVAQWKLLASDPDARFDRELRIDAADGAPHHHLGHQSGPCGGDRSRHSLGRRRRSGRARPAVHGLPCRRAAAGREGRRGVHRFLHQWSTFRSARSGHRAARASHRPACADAGRPRVRRSQARGRGRRPARGLPRRRRGMARTGLLDVHRDERRPCHRGAAVGQHLQPQLRRSPGTGRAHRAGEPCHGGGLRRGRPHRRSARLRAAFAGGRVMDAFSRYRSTLAVLPAENIDTDQIIPARFLTTTERSGLGRHCFADWRFDAEGAERADFALHRPEFRGAGILLAGRNFGCGSSREHAPWALLDFGIRAVISTRIADIFRNNALKNGLLPVVVSVDEFARLLPLAAREIAVDLSTQRIELPDGSSIGFEVEPFARQCLLRGVDQLGYLLSEGEAISAFEGARAA